MMAGLITNGYLLVAEADRGAERRRPRLPADQHRQRRAGRGVEEEPARCSTRSCSGCATTPTSTSTSTRCSAAASRTPKTRGRSTSARARARLLDLDRHHPRRLRPAEAARHRRARGVRRRDAARSTDRGRCSRTCTRASAASRTTSPTASRTSGAAAPARATSTSAKNGLVHYCSQQRGYPGRAARRLHDRRHPARVPGAEVVRAALHDRLRPPRLDDGLLAQAAEAGARPCRRAPSARRPDSRMANPFPSISRQASTSRKSTTPSTRRARKWRSATTSRDRARRSISIANDNTLTLDRRRRLQDERAVGDPAGTPGPARRADQEPDAGRNRARRQRHGPARRHAPAGHPDRSREGDRQVPEGSTS